MWDSTRFSETRYTYYSGKIKSVTCLDEDQRTFLSAAFYYTNRLLTKEVIINYPQDGFSGIGFKPNSAEFILIPDAGDTIMKSKEYEYRNDSVYIRYFRNKSLTGSGTQKLDAHGKILYEATYNLTHELIYEVYNEYNFRGQLTEQRKFETGYTGFGE